MNNEEILKQENIVILDDGLRVDRKEYKLSDIESLYIGEQNPARDRAYVFIAVGIILMVLTSRWFFAGGVVSILAGIVTFFDSRRKYTIILKTKDFEKAIVASYDLKKIKIIEAEIRKKTAP
ncbi:MAG: hypothetical protein COB22_03845 [Cycloclasticus sp.]|nr:MAG: hypothetical protein COB22_03845 [Cycloclasticus sp.]